MSKKAKVMPAMMCASIDYYKIISFEWNFMPFIKIIFCYGDLLAAILKMVGLTMSGQCFSLETVISEILLMMFTWALVYQNGVSHMVLGPLVASLVGSNCYCCFESRR